MPRYRKLGNPGARPAKAVPRLTADQKRLASDPETISMSQAMAVKWHHKTGLPEDECRSSAAWALCRAAGMFDPCRGVEFRTLAYGWIRRELRSLESRLAPSGRRDWAAARATPPMLSLDYDRGDDGGRLGLLFAAPEDKWSGRREDGEVLAPLVKILGGNRGKLIRRMLRTGEGVAEAGRHLGLDSRNASAVFHSSVERMRQKAVELDLWRRLDL